MSVRANLQALQAKLKGRATLLGVAKGQSPEKIREAIEAGLQDVGNNYTQEGAELRDQMPPARWHFIGAIQSRKVKELLDYDLIHSLDRVDIAEMLQKQLTAKNSKIRVLIEINLAGEASKAGIAPEALEDFLKAIAGFDRVQTVGIMVLPPPLTPVEKRRPYFKQARALFDAHAALGWTTLSMGTSEDFEIAVEEGATLVRLGTILFGARA